MPNYPIPRDPYQIALGEPLCPAQVAALLEAAFMDGRKAHRDSLRRASGDALFPLAQPTASDEEHFAKSATRVLVTRLEGMAR